MSSSNKQGGAPTSAENREIPNFLKNKIQNFPKKKKVLIPKNSGKDTSGAGSPTSRVFKCNGRDCTGFFYERDLTGGICPVCRGDGEC